MNINRNDLKSLQSAYRKVLTESQETGYNGGMNNQPSYLNVVDEDQFEKEIIMSLADNGDWEYTSMGFGKDAKGLYHVDLQDSGEDLREKHYIKPGMSLKDVINLGLKMRVFDKFSDDDIRVNVEMDGEPAQAEFLKQIEA